MSDIVERLRWRAENTSTPAATTPMLCAEAADLITALRAENERLRAAATALIDFHNGSREARRPDKFYLLMVRLNAVLEERP